ncbi:MAG: hypothetical protein JXM70_10350 [Pirellulales bacterium]|nr:hypothetical protein [Pirellulales bacterium]
MSAEITTAMSQPRSTGPPLQTALWIKTLSVATLLLLLLLVGGMFAWRRLAGALYEPLDAVTLAITAVALAAVSLTVRLLAQGSHSASPRASLWLVALILLVPTAAIVAVGISLSLPGTPVAGLALLWTILAVGELSGLVLARFATETARAALRLGRLSGGLPRKLKLAVSDRVVDRRLRIDAAHEPATQVVEQPATQPQTETDFDESTFDVPPDRSVTQQVTRLQSSDGSEIMTGWLRASFEPGQRTASVHLAFCPPFSTMPSVEVEQVDGPPGRIKTVQLLPYGARFDLKLFNDAEEPLDVLLQFTARA